MSGAYKETWLVFGETLENYIADHEEEITREMITDFYLNNKENSIVYVSAKTSMNIERLKKLIIKKVRKRHYTIYPNFLKNETY